MVRCTEQKKRGRLTRKRKKIILIGVEGANKTEKNYFQGFNRRHGEYVVRFARGNDTDPLIILKSVYIAAQKDEELRFDEGDRAFCVVDTDVDCVKQRQINEAVKYSKNKNVEVILSNPCFEVWLLQHFKYSSKSFSSNEAVIEELKKYIPTYKKSSDVFESLLPFLKSAIDNAKKLEVYHKDAGHRAKSIERNPSSEVYKIVNLLNNSLANTARSHNDIDKTH